MTSHLEHRAAPPGAGSPALRALTETDPHAELVALGDDVTLARLSTGCLQPVATAVAALPGSRFADLFGAGTDPTVLRAVFALDEDAQHLVLEAPADGTRLPGLSRTVPAAFVEECELFEQFGLAPGDEQMLDRLAVPPHVGDFPRLGGTGVLAENVHAPHVVGGQAFEFPVGPVRGVGTESLYYGLVTSGEEVVDLYLFTWHKHRGVEHRLQGLTPERALFLVERAEGLSAVASSWAFAAAVETATGTVVGRRDAQWRAVYLELERLYNHAACLAALCQSTGLAVGQAQAEIAWEQLLRLNAAVSGHRYLFGTVDVGGVRRPPDLAALRAQLPGAHGELRRVLDDLLGTNSFLDRLEATGQLTTEVARDQGLVGPVARAAGMPVDTRVDHPREPYLHLGCDAAVGAAGDALSRLQVMSAEIEESAVLIARILEEAEEPGGRQPGAPERAEPQGCGLGWAESPRGESLAWVQLADDGTIERARLRPASVRNWRAFDDAVRAQNVFTDVPIIEASFWLTVAGRAL